MSLNYREQFTFILAILSITDSNLINPPNIGHPPIEIIGKEVTTEKLKDPLVGFDHSPPLIELDNKPSETLAPDKSNPSDEEVSSTGDNDGQSLNGNDQPTALGVEKITSNVPTSIGLLSNEAPTLTHLTFLPTSINMDYDQPSAIDVNIITSIVPTSIGLLSNEEPTLVHSTILPTSINGDSVQNPLFITSSDTKHPINNSETPSSQAFYQNPEMLTQSPTVIVTNQVISTQTENEQSNDSLDSTKNEVPSSLLRTGQSVKAFVGVYLSLIVCIMIAGMTTLYFYSKKGHEPDNTSFYVQFGPSLS